MNAVDVVIPAYDAGVYLAEAIASVRAQTYAAARIVVIDDGSTDTTGEIVRGARTHDEVLVELIRFDVNRGAAAARNAGVAATHSPWVAFLDADDRWTPRKLELQCAALDADPALAFVLCGVQPFVSPELVEEERRRLQGEVTVREGWTASALVARRTLFDRIGGFPEALRVGEVIDWFSRARRYPHAVLDVIGVERRLHRGNSTRRAQVTGRDYFEVVRRHRARLRTQDPR